ncbi:SMC hinge domain-containing protein [Mycena sanguinolenta]|uniref:SMC hinge domain-containing protein n=1 Tax=Mycena sanguinolenta TaxID=230812 RepID=A0A8H6ZEK7_9AGAR|nr:SMC hinge domain-containing protein [Mycena sanguinolenta]
MDDHHRKVSGTKRAAQSASGRAYQPIPSGSHFSPAPSSSRTSIHPRNPPGPSSSGSRYVPAPHQPSGFSAPMQPSNQRSYVPGSILGPARTKRISYPHTQPLPHPTVSRSRKLWKRPERQADSSPITTKRITASVISAPLPTKLAKHNPPHWQVSDSASARANDSRRFAIKTVGSRSVSEYRMITTTNFAYSNENVRKDYESSASTGPIARKSAARKHQDEEEVVPQTGNESESESESSTDSDDEEPDPSASEPESELDQLDQLDSSDDDEVVIVEPPKPPVIELLDDTPPVSPVILPTPPEEIIAGIEDLTLALTCMQKKNRLPFLKRNVRRGFLQYCRARGVPTHPQDLFPPTTVAFRLADSDLPPHEASISCYECPLCELHLPFQTKEMLGMHLELDHGEVQITWDGIDEQNVRLILVLPARMSPSPSFCIRSPRPEPPPPPFGPTARYPFLPAKSEYGGPDVTRSVRFDGPRIYDLLNTLPMEPFGVLAWAVIEKEEEIFESDDMPDEHKVMHALWARWIHFNRRVPLPEYSRFILMLCYSNFFISDYFQGAKKFIDDYWKMIRLAAGLDALRYYLVMLSATKFLTMKHVALLLKHYEKWCDDF